MVYCPLCYKWGNLGPYLSGALMVYHLFVYVWVAVWCLESYWKLVTHTNVLSSPLRHCMIDSSSDITNTRHQMSKSDQDTAQGGGCISRTKNRLEPDHQNLKTPIMSRYLVIYQWDVWHSGYQCTTTTCRTKTSDIKIHQDTKQYHTNPHPIHREHKYVFKK